MAKIINRVGETNTSFNGEKMTIVAYRGNTDIDILFEDGTIVTNKCYIHFKKGTIKNPNYTKNKYIGKQKRAKNGQMMTIIAYRDFDDLSIQFEDGTIIKKVGMSQFNKGSITNPNLKQKDKDAMVGLESTSSFGQKMTVIAYRKSNDIDVKFEDGTIVTNTTIGKFRDGLIRNPNYFKSRWVGQTSKHLETGMTMTIIDYRSNVDVDIQFEDGHIVYNKSTSSFKKGQVEYQEVNFLGSVNRATNGMLMEVIGYRGYQSLDVRFEDGTVVSNVGSYCFKSGTVKHPTVSVRNKKVLAKTSQIANFKLLEIAYIYKDTVYYICECMDCGLIDILNVEEILNHSCKIW